MSKEGLPEAVSILTKEWANTYLEKEERNADFEPKEIVKAKLDYKGAEINISFCVDFTDGKSRRKSIRVGLGEHAPLFNIVDGEFEYVSGNKRAAEYALKILGEIKREDIHFID